MAHYRALGRLPRQRHTQLRDEDGHLFREELMGEEGFSSDSSLLYHRGVPSAITSSEVWELPDQSRTPNHPLKPRHLRLHDLETGTCPVEGRRMVLRTLEMASVPAKLVSGQPVADLGGADYEIRRALDMAFSGF